MNVGISGFNGARLAEARQARGLTGVALAELVGVTPPSISQYENGKSSPRLDVLDAIATTLRLPRAYFTRESAAPDDAPLFWRCRATSSRVARDRAEIRLVWAREILAYLSGKMRMHRIKVLIGDSVEVVIDPYGGKGRIVKRL